MNWPEFFARMFRFRLASVLIAATALAAVAATASWLAAHRIEQLAGILAVTAIVYVVIALVLLAKGLILGSVTEGERGARLASVGMWMLLTLPMHAACAYAVSVAPAR